MVQDRRQSAIWQKSICYIGVTRSMVSEVRRTLMTENRRAIWDKIQEKHFGGCMWQHISKNRKCVMEGLVHRATGRIVIVEKTYDNPIPRMSDSSLKPWPELAGVNVYAPI